MSWTRNSAISPAGFRAKPGSWRAMDWQSAINDSRMIAAAAAAAAALLLLIGGWLWWRRRQRDPRQRLQAAALDLLQDIVVPDGDGGQLHIGFALLTPGGIKLVDLRDVDGHVFGSNAMQDWTVLADRRRFTFANPQHAMLDRVAAVKRLLPDIDVQGLVTFTARARFTKGLPEHVAQLDTLVEELRRGAGAAEVPGLREAWDRLRQEAVAAQVGRLIND